MPRAVVIRSTGGPEVLAFEEHDPGAPPAGAVRVRVHAAGVNFIDVYFRTGLYPAPLPFVMGLEGAGVVESVVDGVTGLAAGDHVAWASVPGSYAETVVAPADRVDRARLADLSERLRKARNPDWAAAPDAKGRWLGLSKLFARGT